MKLLILSYFMIINYLYPQDTFSLYPIDTSFSIVNIKQSNPVFFTKVNWTNDEYNRLTLIADSLNTNVLYLDAIIYHESHGNSMAINPISNSVGLIQFMPSTLKWMGYSFEEVYFMSRLDQMNIILKYYSVFGNSYNDPYSLWMTTFYPYAVTQLNNDEYIIGSEKSLNYANHVASSNKGFDLNFDGYITIKEYKKYHLKYL